MIISLNSIVKYVSQKDDTNHQLLIDLVKLIGGDVPDLMRKNLANASSGKHRQTETTKKNINRWLNEVLMPLDDIDLYERWDVSTPELTYIHHERQYMAFFHNLGVDDSFLVKELKKAFLGMSEINQLIKDGASKEELKPKLFCGELFPKVNYENNLNLEINIKGIADLFSLDWLLYFFGCIDVQNQSDVSYLQLMFEAFDNDIKVDGALKPPFFYYVDILKVYFKTNDMDSTNEAIAEDLNIDVRDIYRYKSGKRTPSLNAKKSIIKNRDFIYYMICFWVNLINEFSADTKIMMTIMAKISEYPRFQKIAKIEYERNRKGA